jgi:hypothetical protein
MNLHRDRHSVNVGIWLTIAALVLAALAFVQLVAGSTPILWLLAGCVAVWALLAQASHTQDDDSIRLRSRHNRARSARH